MKSVLPLEEIYDAATDDSCLEQLASSLAKALNARSGVLHWRHVSQDHCWISDSGYFDRSTMTAYDRQFSGHDLWARAVRRPRAVNRAWLGEEHVPTAEFANSVIYNEWVRTSGDDTMFSLGAALHHGSFQAELGFHRGRSQGGFDEDDCRALNELLDHLRRMMMIRSKLAAADRHLALSQNASNVLAHAVFTLSLDGRLLHANPNADNILKLRDGLALREGRLVALLPGDQAKLSDALSVAPKRATALLVQRPGGGSHEVSIISTTMKDAGRQLLVCLRMPGVRDRSVEARLRALYQLTESEAKIAAALAEGLSVADLAERRATADGTIRTQLKSIAHKMNCARQSEIVSAVRRLPILSA